MSRELKYLYFEKKILGLSCYITQSEQILRAKLNADFMSILKTLTSSWRRNCYLHCKGNAEEIRFLE